MKVSKKTGKVKLEANEVRVGNFFVCREETHVKVQDLNGVFHVRINRMMAVGMWLENAWAGAMSGDEAAINTLKTYVATMWSLISVVPDDEYVSDALTMADAALHRHPSWYGVKEDATEEDDQKAVEAVEETARFEQEVKDALEGK